MACHEALFTVIKTVQVPQSLVPMLTDVLVKQISDQSGASIIVRQDTRTDRTRIKLLGSAKRGTSAVPRKHPKNYSHICF